MDPSYWQNTAFALFWLALCAVIVVAGLAVVIIVFVGIVGIPFGWWEDKPADKPKNVPSTGDVVLEHYRHMVNWTIAQPTGILKGDLLAKLKEEFEIV